MKHLLTLIFIYLHCIVFAQVTLIPDPNFEQALIDLGYDSGSVDGSVLTDNIKNIQYLTINNKNISDLTGIQDFKNLIELKCDYNKLSSLDVSQNIALSRIYCRYMNLTSLDFTKNTYLRNVFCDGNDLVSLNVENNKLMIFLMCNDNNLAQLNITNNTYLEVLQCDNNKLTSIDVSKNLLLEELSVKNNLLTQIDVSKNNALLTLDCAENFITEIDISMIPLLSDILCSSNQITDLDLHENYVLRTIDCSSNKLKSLNLKNTSNNIITYLHTNNNPELLCMIVDDPEVTKNKWLVNDYFYNIDTWTELSASPCQTEQPFLNVSLLATHIEFLFNKI